MSATQAECNTPTIILFESMYNKKLIYSEFLGDDSAHLGKTVHDIKVSCKYEKETDTHQPFINIYFKEDLVDEDEDFCITSPYVSVDFSSDILFE